MSFDPIEYLQWHIEQEKMKSKPIEKEKTNDRIVNFNITKT